VILKVTVNGLSDSLEQAVTIRFTPVNMLEGSELLAEDSKSLISFQGFLLLLLVSVALLDALNKDLLPFYFFEFLLLAPPTPFLLDGISGHFEFLRPATFSILASNIVFINVLFANASEHSQYQR
jgi:hypothetical protein